MKKKFLLIFTCVCISYSTFAQGWISLGGGLNNQTRVLFEDTVSDKLYVGGTFTRVDGHYGYGISAWDGAIWDTLNGGIGCCYSSPSSIGSEPFTIIRYQNQLYAGGWANFLYGSPYSVRINGFTRWNGTSWDSLNIAFHNSGVPGFFYEYNNLLYCIGAFDSAGGFYSPIIAAWDGVNWIPVGLPNGVIHTTAFPTAMATFQNKLYILGSFYDSIANTSFIFLTWDGTNWNEEGFNCGGLTHAMAVYHNELYIGGNNFGGCPCDYLVKYDGTSFSCVGNGFVGNVWHLRVIDDKLFAVGYIDSAGGLPVSNMAVWDGNNWSAFSNDTFNNAITDVAVFNNELYVTGGFTMINSDTVNYIAKYDGWYLGEELPVKKTDAIKVYPNPVSDNLTIEISAFTSDKKYLSIYNVMGEEIIKSQIPNSKFQTNVSNLASGIYIAEVSNGKNVLRKKFVKE